MASRREHFSSRWAVIFTMAGSAIGLGNIWRFPYMVGEHGGAAFVVLYVLATILVSLPVFIAEVTLGRRSRCNASSAMTAIRPGFRLGKLAGVLAIFIPLLIASYYSVIGGWSLEYFVKSCTGAMVTGDPEAVSSLFGDFISRPWAPVIMHLVFLGLCASVVILGVKSGIEKFSKFSIPVLFVLIVVMLVYSVTLPGAGAGVKYLLKPDFSQITPRSFVYALGQSFYSLSLGMGAIVTYGSYVRKDEDIVVSSTGTAISDLMFALLASFAIMPAVFAGGIEPGAGPGLIFQSIPFIFSSLGAKAPLLSIVVSSAFFLTVVVAAMTSNISLLEVGVSFLGEKFGMSRLKSCISLFLLCGAVGVVCSLSFGPLSGITLSGMNIFDMCDGFCSNVLLLILAFITVVFVGFKMKKDDVRDEITNGGAKTVNGKLFPIIYFLIRWVAPIAIAAIFITNFIL